MTLSKIKFGLYGAAFFTFLSFSGVSHAICLSVALSIPQDLAPYIEFDHPSKKYANADQATKDRTDEFLKSQKEMTDLGQENCDLTARFDKNDSKLMERLHENNSKKKAIFEKWGDPNKNATITTPFNKSLEVGQ